MAVVSYATIGGGLVGPDKQALRRFFWLERAVVAKKRRIYRREDLKALPGRSFLPQIAQAWNALSDDVKSEWDYAANVIRQHGYNLFVQDKAYRIKNLLAGNADPDLYHQYLIGHINIPEGAGDVLLRQTGSFVFDFPAILRVRFKTILSTDNGNGEFVKMRFKFVYDEGGGEQTETKEIELPKASGWDARVGSLVEHYGLTGDWELEIEINNLKGDLYFDNIWVGFPVGIVNKDPYCLDVVESWSKITWPPTATLETIYPTGDAL